MIEIKQISALDTYQLRIQVLRNGIAENYQFAEDHNDDTLHIGAFKNKELVGIATLIKNRFKHQPHLSAYQLRGMAVVENLQDFGIGTLILEFIDKFLSAKDVDMVWCNARIKALGFYKKMGYITKGKAFNIPKIGLHFVMYKEM